MVEKGLRLPSCWRIMAHTGVANCHIMEAYCQGSNSAVFVYFLNVVYTYVIERKQVRPMVGKYVEVL